MANFLTRLVTRHLGLTPVVQPFIAPMFASESVVLGSNSPGFEVQTSSIDSSWEEQRSWGGDEVGRRGTGESSSGTGKMPIPQAETSSSGGVGVSPAHARGTSSEIHLSRQENTQTSRTGKMPIPQVETSNSGGVGVSPAPPMNANSEIHLNKQTQPSSSPTPKADTPQYPVVNFIATPPTQPPAALGMIQRQVDASMRSHSSIDSPVNPPNLAESDAFAVEDISLEQPTLPLVPPQAIPSVQPTTTNAPSRVEPLINEVLETGQQRDNIESGLNFYHKNKNKSIISQQNTPTTQSSEQMQGGIEGEMGRNLQDDSSSQPASTVSSRTFSQQPETSTDGNPPLRATAQRREFFQLVPQRLISGSQSLPVLGVPDGETRRLRRPEKESVGSSTATGDERMPDMKLPSNIVVETDAGTRGHGDAEKMNVLPMNATEYELSFLPHQNVDDPPKSPLKRGTLSSIVPPLTRETLSSIVSPLTRETLSSIVPSLTRETLSSIVPPLTRETLSNIVSPVMLTAKPPLASPFLRGTGGGSKRGARGDRVMSSTFETPPESSNAMQIEVLSEKLSSLTRRSLSVLSQSSSRQSRVYPITHDVPEFPSSRPTHRRNPANFTPTTQLNPVETTPTIQISIGRIEVRANQPQTPPPRTKSTQRGPTQSLQDYLKQRQGGNS